MDIGGATTGITDKNGVVCDAGVKIQRWADVDVIRFFIIGLGSLGWLGGGDKICIQGIVRSLWKR